MSSIQFTIPNRAVDAVDFPALRHAIAAKLTATSIEHNTPAAPIGQTRITCFNSSR
jgi:hypothetical protein